MSPISSQSSGPATRSRALFDDRLRSGSSPAITSPTPIPTGLVDSVVALGIEEGDLAEEKASASASLEDVSEESKADISTAISEVPPRFRDVTCKKSGLLYSSKVSEAANNTRDYNYFMDSIHFSSRLVMYDIGKEYTAVGSRDSDWTFRPIHIENATVPASAHLRAKYHDLWDRTEVRGRTQATNSCESNLYVSKMLALFQGELKFLWSHSHGRAAEIVLSKRRITHALSCALKIPPALLVQTIGSLPADEAPWLVCKHKPDGFNDCYIHDYQFEDTQPNSNPWAKLIHAFCHFTFERSDYQTMICQLDCDGDGLITSLECYQRRTPYL